MTFHVPLSEWFDLGMACSRKADSESLFHQLILAMKRIGAEKVMYVHFPPFGTDPVRDPLTLTPHGYRLVAFGEYADDDTASTKRARDHKDVTDLIVTPPAARAVALRGREGGGSIEIGGDVANALRASSGGSDKEHVLAPIPLVELGCHTGRAGHETKDGLGVDDGDANAVGQVAVAFKASHYTRGKDGAPSEVYPPLTADADKGDQDPIVMTNIATTMIVRRLMPVECERLQGFPADWTFVPVGRKMAADGPRYKQLGNSWAVSCVRWYGARITAHLADIERPAIEASATADDGMIVWMTAP